MENKLMSIDFKGTNNWASGFIQDTDVKSVMTYFLSLIEGKTITSMEVKNGDVILKLTQDIYTYECSIKNLEGYILDTVA